MPTQGDNAETLAQVAALMSENHQLLERLSEVKEDIKGR